MKKIYLTPDTASVWVDMEENELGVEVLVFIGSLCGVRTRQIVRKFLSKPCLLKSRVGNYEWTCFSSVFAALNIEYLLEIAGVVLKMSKIKFIHLKGRYS